MEDDDTLTKEYGCYKGDLISIPELDEAYKKKLQDMCRWIQFRAT